MDQPEQNRGPVDNPPLDRETEDHFEIFNADADGILDWVKSTEPTPSRKEVLDHIQWLRAQGILPDEETAKLAGTYPELLGHEMPED